MMDGEMAADNQPERPEPLDVVAIGNQNRNKRESRPWFEKTSGTAQLAISTGGLF